MDRDRRGGFGRGSFGSRRPGPSFDTPKPVKIGEEYDVKITDVGAKGDGICKVENFIVFVPNAKKGESCKIKIKEVASRFAIAEKVGEGSAPESEGSEEAESSEDTEESKEGSEESEKSEESEDKDTFEE